MSEIIAPHCKYCKRTFTQRPEPCLHNKTGVAHSWEYDTPVRDESRVQDF